MPIEQVERIEHIEQVDHIEHIELIEQRITYNEMDIWSKRNKYNNLGQIEQRESIGNIEQL